MPLKPSDYDQNGDIIPDSVKEELNNLPWWAKAFNQEMLKQTQHNMDALNAFEVLKAYCKNRDCNKDCIFFREVMMGNKKDTFCALCEIVMSDDKEKDNEQK